MCCRGGRFLKTNARRKEEKKKMNMYYTMWVRRSFFNLVWASGESLIFPPMYLLFRIALSSSPPLTHFRK